MNSLNLGETWLLDNKKKKKKKQEYSRLWDTFRLWLVIACNRQNRCDKSTAQRFWTAIVRAMGQQKRSKRTISNSIDLVLKPNLSHFSFLKSPHKKHVFSNFLGLIWRGRGGFYKKLCTRVSLQNAERDKSHPETRTSITHRICALWAKETLSMDSLNLGDIWLLDKKSRNLVEWDTFRLWLEIACNRQNRCDKSTAQRFWTAIVRAMGQHKNDLSAQLQIQLIGFETKSVPFFLLKGLFRIFWGSSYHEMIVGQEPKMAWGFRYGTTHPKINHYKMHFRFLSAKWNAATRCSARPFTTKTGARVHFFCLNSPRNRRWYQARVHPFSSGNGKGDAQSTFRSQNRHKKPQCRTAFGSWHVEKVHTVVARSTFGSEKCKRLMVSDHFRKLGCGFAWHAQDIFGTLPKVSKTWRFCSSFKNVGRRGTFEEDLQRCISRGRR